MMAKKSVGMKTKGRNEDLGIDLSSCFILDTYLYVVRFS